MEASERRVRNTLRDLGRKLIEHANDPDANVTTTVRQFKQTIAMCEAELDTQVRSSERSIH
jgi:hypothetical protein